MNDIITCQILLSMYLYCTVQYIHTKNVMYKKMCKASQDKNIGDIMILFEVCILLKIVRATLSAHTVDHSQVCLVYRLSIIDIRDYMLERPL